MTTLTKTYATEVAARRAVEARAPPACRNATSAANRSVDST